MNLEGARSLRALVSYLYHIVAFSAIQRDFARVVVLYYPAVSLLNTHIPLRLNSLCLHNKSPYRITQQINTGEQTLTFLE